MTQQTDRHSGMFNSPLKLAEAVEAYVAQGGVISRVPDGETRHSCRESQGAAERTCTPTTQAESKIEQLKGLVAKGAGVTALQYSLRMNRKDIKRLASENGVTIHHSRPVRGSRSQRSRDITIDDAIAGHAMHYSALGYTVPEIAQLLDIAVRDVWNIGKAYRFEFRRD